MCVCAFECVCVCVAPSKFECLSSPPLRRDVYGKRALELASAEVRGVLERQAAAGTDDVTTGPEVDVRPQPTSFLCLSTQLIYFSAFHNADLFTETQGWHRFHSLSGSVAMASSRFVSRRPTAPAATLAALCSSCSPAD